MITTQWQVKGVSHIVNLSIVQRRFIYRATDARELPIPVRPLMGRAMRILEYSHEFSGYSWFIYMNIANRPAIAPMKDTWAKALEADPEMCHIPSRIEDLQSFLELTS